MRIVTALSLAGSILIFSLSPVSLAQQGYGYDNGYSSTNHTQKHVVQPGESLSQIAQMYGYPVALLSHHNSISDPDEVMVGQIIYMPGNEYPEELLLPEDSPAAGKEAAAGIPMDNRFYQSEMNQNQVTTSPPLPRNSSAPYPANQMNANPANMGAPIPSQQPRQAFNTTKPYAYFGNGEPVADVLRNFASNYGIPIVLSEFVEGIVNGRFGPLTPVEFLDKMAHINNLIWYFDGNTLYIYNSQEIEKEIISLQYMSAEEFRQTLIDIGIWDNRFYWRAKPAEGIIYLSGPPRYMELVTQTASLLDSKAGTRQKSQMTVKVFPLKYAWADDRTFNFRSEQVTIPGVASILREIVQGGGISMSGGVTHQAMQSVQKATPAGGNAQPSSDPNPNVKAENVYINADRRLNAVIVHDLTTKMAMYASLINTLDKPLAQVEINVSIIDINTDSLDRLGVNWKLDLNSSGSDFIEFNPFSSDTNVSDTFSTIIQNTSGRLFTQVNLLSSEGKAKVLARPSVLTLDNMEAVLDNSQTFYVEVASTEDAQLFPVTYGSVLKVTPRIVEEVTGRKIHLSVNIQDGARGDTKENVKELPTIKNSTISTQAVIDENESLLIGGYYYESNNQSVSKVPVLGDIPLVGAMFRSKSDTYVKTVRLFLITPRIVNLM